MESGDIICRPTENGVGGGGSGGGIKKVGGTRIKYFS